MDKIPFDPYDFFGYLASGVVVILGMQFVFGFPMVLGHEFKVIEGIILLLAAYVGGHLMASPAKALLEGLVVDKVLKRPSINLLRSKKPKGHFFFPDFYAPLPSTVQQAVIKKKDHGGKIKDGEATFLHIRFADEIQKDEKLQAKLSIFLTKYGFARNLSFTCILFAVAIWVKILVTPDPDPNAGPVVAKLDPNLGRYAVTAAVTGILLFYRYLKFFRQYSYELFNAYGGK